MQAWTDFFSTDYGLMSAAVIVFMLGMAVFFVRFFVRNMNEDEAREKLRQKN
jgi:TRAP-type C4-dicarboxylate transport system permease small subunit